METVVHLQLLHHNSHQPAINSTNPLYHNVVPSNSFQLERNASMELFDLENTTASHFDLDDFLRQQLGSRNRNLADSIVLTVVYSAIFLTGLLGNACTCVVIVTNSHMHTATNYYLFSLALSDMLTLVLGLPPEVYAIWEAYPWRFGQPYCLLKTFLTEMTASASILTIAAFTVERYVAICHPLRAHSYSRPSRAVKTVFAVWILALASALPYPINTRIYAYLQHPVSGEPILESVICNLMAESMSVMRTVFEASTFILFVLPICLITVLYTLIGVRLRVAAPGRTSVILQANSDSAAGTNTTTRSTGTAASRSTARRTSQGQSRRNVIRMLVAVVIAFVLCWAPFHAQRLMTVYIAEEQWTPELLQLESQLFYISGILYFINATVNPILYNVLSRRYRLAFRDTFCFIFCCSTQSHVTRSPSSMAERTSLSAVRLPPSGLPAHGRR